MPTINNNNNRLLFWRPPLELVSFMREAEEAAAETVLYLCLVGQQPLSVSESPWCDLHGWLGIKYQISIRLEIWKCARSSEQCMVRLIDYIRSHRSVLALVNLAFSRPTNDRKYFTCFPWIFVCILWFIWWEMFRFSIRLDQFLVPVQCTGKCRLIPRGKWAAIVQHLPTFLFFFLPVFFVFPYHQLWGLQGSHGL